MFTNGLRQVTATLLLAALVSVGVSGCLLVPFPVFDGGHHGHGHHDHGRW